MSLKHPTHEEMMAYAAFDAIATIIARMGFAPQAYLPTVVWLEENADAEERRGNGEDAQTSRAFANLLKRLIAQAEAEE